MVVVVVVTIVLGGSFAGQLYSLDNLQIIFFPHSRLIRRGHDSYLVRDVLQHLCTRTRVVSGT